VPSSKQRKREWHSKKEGQPEKVLQAYLTYYKKVAKNTRTQKFNMGLRDKTEARCIETIIKRWPFQKAVGRTSGEG